MSSKNRTCVLIKESHDQVERWRDALMRMDPDIEVRIFPYIGDIHEVDFALVWNPPHGMLASLPNIKAVMSVGAGVDHVLSDPNFPRHLPLIRMVDPGLTDAMVEFITMSALMCSRRMFDVFLNQAQQIWHPIEVPLAREVSVSVLGLGKIGLSAAKMLKTLGYRVMGWSRNERAVEGIETFHDKRGLERMLGWTDILINVLPLTRETRGILGAGTFNRLPKGACVINVGRGEHCKEEDLLKALNSDRLSCAILDVFQDEPLPESHPFWTHEKVIISPHMAGLTRPESGVQAIFQMINEAANGETFTNRVDVSRGY